MTSIKIAAHIEREESKESVEKESDNSDDKQNTEFKVIYDSLNEVKQNTKILHKKFNILSEQLQ